MTFTFLVDEQGYIFRRLLELYYPNGARVIDLTFGKGKLWAEIFRNPLLRAMYPVTACDAAPDANAVRGVLAVKKNLFTDNYDDLGLHDVALYDPPYLVDRVSFDYVGASSRSWAASDLEKFTSNSSVEVFNFRTECLRRKATSFLKPGGTLLVKVMDPRKDGCLIAHHINIVNTLSPSFELTDVAVYQRLGASTWQIEGHLHNLHGYWLTFRLRGQSDEDAASTSSQGAGGATEHVQIQQSH
jgi:hypothetical protein